jgi:hypothetical protein
MKKTTTHYDKTKIFIPKCEHHSCTYSHNISLVTISDVKLKGPLCVVVVLSFYNKEHKLT